MKKDYVVQITVKNGPLLRIMRERGFHTAVALSRASGVRNDIIGKYLSLKQTPLNKHGRWNESILGLSETLGTLPGDLFPPQHISEALTTNKAEMEMSLEEVQALPQSAMELLEHHTPEEKLINDDIRNALYDGLEKLTPRERDVLERLFGLHEQEAETLEAVGYVHGISRERVRQIQFKALRKLKHPAYTSAIKEAGLPFGKALRANRP